MNKIIKSIYRICLKAILISTIFSLLFSFVLVLIFKPNNIKINNIKLYQNTLKSSFNFKIFIYKENKLFKNKTINNTNEISFKLLNYALNKIEINYFVINETIKDGFFKNFYINIKNKVIKIPRNVETTIYLYSEFLKDNIKYTYQINSGFSNKFGKINILFVKSYFELYPFIWIFGLYIGFFVGMVSLFIFDFIIIVKNIKNNNKNKNIIL